jgi:hypothetical protein
MQNNQMTKTIALSLLIVLLISCQKQNVEDVAIKATYNGYREAILNDKGEEATNYVDNKTIKYYEEILRKVKTSNEDEVKSRR